MVHAFHIVFGTYGFWLPNDPRGAWSDFVGKCELYRFGPASKTRERNVSLTPSEQMRLAVAKASLNYPVVSLSTAHVRSVASGFERCLKNQSIGLWACSILSDHVHLVARRGRLSADQMTRLLKGAATKQLIEDRLHPMAEFQLPGRKVPSLWARGKWVSFLDSEESIEQAIQYVTDNPTKVGQPPQPWPFVSAFPGLNLRSGWISYGP